MKAVKMNFNIDEMGSDEQGTKHNLIGFIGF